MSVYLETAQERAAHKWECTYVHPLDPHPVGDAVVRGICAHVWQLYRLPDAPPIVRRVGPNEPGYISGALASVSVDGCYMDLYSPKVTTVIVLHELAHSLTEDPLDRMELRALNEREVHGALFLGNFLDLLDRLMGPRFNKLRLMHTLVSSGVPVRPGWAPVIRGQIRGDL
jgi:hypothetical protein